MPARHHQRDSNILVSNHVILSTSGQLGEKSLSGRADFVFPLAVVGVDCLPQGAPDGRVGFSGGRGMSWYS